MQDFLSFFFIGKKFVRIASAEHKEKSLSDSEECSLPTGLSVFYIKAKVPPWFAVQMGSVANSVTAKDTNNH